MTKEKRLGRGLESLLARLATPEAAAHHPAVDSQANAAGPFDATAPAEAADQPQDADAAPPRLPVDQIDSNPYQPRQEFDTAEIAALAESLAAHGLLQPVVVRRVGGRYQLVVGERRLRAARLAGWTDVPAQVVEADDRQTAELAIVENLQRRDLNAIEKAGSFQRYIEQYGCTQEDLARRLKLDRSTVANLIRLLELPPAVQEAVRRGKVTQGHARALLPLGDEEEQVEFCERIQREELSVRQTEGLVQELIREADAEPLAAGVSPVAPARRPSAQISALEQQFRAALGMKVALRPGAAGKGKLVIHFRNHDEFERLRQLVCAGEARKAG